MKHGLKNLSIFAVGMAFNGYCMYHAVEANKQYNQYLANLSPEDLEKKKAKEWYLRQTVGDPGWRHVVQNVSDNQIYNGFSEKQKARILVKYRWATLDESRPSEPRP